MKYDTNTENILSTATSSPTEKGVGVLVKNFGHTNIPKEILPTVESEEAEEPDQNPSLRQCEEDSDRSLLDHCLLKKIAQAIEEIRGIATPVCGREGKKI